MPDDIKWIYDQLFRAAVVSQMIDSFLKILDFLCFLTWVVDIGYLFLV